MTPNLKLLPISRDGHSVRYETTAGAGPCVCPCARVRHRQGADTVARLPESAHKIPMSRCVWAVILCLTSASVFFSSGVQSQDFRSVQHAVSQNGLLGPEGAIACAAREDVDLVVAAISGGAGLLSTAAAVEAGKVVGLANKESMVLAGELLVGRAPRTGATILPDRQRAHRDLPVRCAGHHRAEVRRIILTASGGPLRRRARGAAARRARPAQALKHPNWSMGAEDHHRLRDPDEQGPRGDRGALALRRRPERIDIVVHPESIVHSMVEYVDGSVVAQLGRLGHARADQLRDGLSRAAEARPRRRSTSSRLGRLTFEAARPGALPGLHAGLPRARARRDRTRRALRRRRGAPSRRSWRGAPVSPTSPTLCSEVLDAHVPEPVRSAQQALAASEWGRGEALRQARLR